MVTFWVLTFAVVTIGIDGTGSADRAVIVGVPQFATETQCVAEQREFEQLIERPYMLRCVAVSIAFR